MACAVLDVPAGRATKKSPVASVARPARAPAESAESAVFSVNGRTPPEPTAGVTETLPENAAAASASEFDSDAAAPRWVRASSGDSETARCRLQAACARRRATPGGRLSAPARARLPTRRASRARRARRLEGSTVPATPRARSRSRIGRRSSRAAANTTTPRASRRLETSPERRSKSRRTPVRWTRSHGGPARLSGRRRRPPRRPRWPTSSRVTRAARNVSSGSPGSTDFAAGAAGLGSRRPRLELPTARAGSRLLAPVADLGTPTLGHGLHPRAVRVTLPGEGAIEAWSLRARKR